MEDLAIAPHDAAPHASAETGPAATVSGAVQRSPEEAQQLVLDLIAAHADSLLRTARRYSLCAEDAQDAYQRGLEILLRHAGRLDADRAGGWLHTVVKHEAIAINRIRSRSVEGQDVDFDAIETRTSPSPEDRVLAFEQVSRSAEALQRLKPQEVRALWLKAMGNSYQEICDATGWTYTKVNRCLAEGRKSFLSRYAGIEAGEECRRFAPVLSAMVDGEATAEQLMELRPHLRNCAACRAAVRELRGSNAPLAALFPIGGVALLGGDGGTGRFDAAGDFLTRVWHMLWGDLSDRAATAAFRAQSAAQAILPGKSMAVFASAAALAGGGFAIDEAAHDVRPPRAALEVPSVSTAADRITRAVVSTTPAVTTAATRPTASKAKPKPKKARAPRQRVRRRAAIAPASTTPRTSGASPLAPATATAAAAAPQSAPKAPPPAATPARRPTGSTTSTGEFALESH